jgi:DedD protein
MEPLYRQRLIGAMVLVTMAVVILPLLLGEPRSVRDAADGVRVDVPEAPRFGSGVSAESEAVTAMDSASAFPDEDLAPPAPSAESLDAWLNPDDASGMVSPLPPAVATTEPVTASTPAPTDPADPAKSSAGDPAGAAAPDALAKADPGTGTATAGGVWVVQVGSFKELDNARRRVEQLQARSFEAWVAEPETAGGPFRVWVGPELERDRATELEARIKRELELDAQVKRHVSN